MFIVTKKAHTPNIVWDASSGRPLCRFENGIFETGDEDVAAKLKALGHTVEGEADAKPLDKMKVEELQAYAAEHGIDLGEATKKADILEIIQKAEAGK